MLLVRGRGMEGGREREIEKVKVGETERKIVREKKVIMSNINKHKIS